MSRDELTTEGSRDFLDPPLPEPTHLFEALTSYRALDAAFRRARKGHRGKREETAFFCDQETEILRLSDELRNLEYRPRPYKCFRIRDPKPRTISVAFRDRVVHHALVSSPASRRPSTNTPTPPARTRAPTGPSPGRATARESSRIS